MRVASLKNQSSGKLFRTDSASGTAAVPQAAPGTSGGGGSLAHASPQAPTAREQYLSTKAVEGRQGSPRGSSGNLISHGVSLGTPRAPQAKGVHGLVSSRHSLGDHGLAGGGDSLHAGADVSGDVAGADMCGGVAGGELRSSYRDVRGRGSPPPNGNTTPGGSNLRMPSPSLLRRASEGSTTVSDSPSRNVSFRLVPSPTSLTPRGESRNSLPPGGSGSRGISPWHNETENQTSDGRRHADGRRISEGAPRSSPRTGGQGAGGAREVRRRTPDGVVLRNYTLK